MENKRVVKTVPVAKKDVEILNEKDRKELIAFMESPAYSILSRLAQDALQNISMDTMDLNLTSSADMAIFNQNKGMMRGVMYIIDACKRAEEIQKGKAVNKKDKSK